MMVPSTASVRPDTRLVGDSAFGGMDAQTQPERLTDGLLQRMENVCVEPGGNLISRPPLVGQFTVPLPAALYAPTVYHDASGPTKIVFGSGNRLYWCAPGGETYTDITYPGGAPLDVSGDTLRLDRFGKWLYGFDKNGVLFRTDTTSAHTVSGLDAPAQPLAASLTSTVLDKLNDPVRWASDTIGSPANQIVNGTFDAPGTVYDVIPHWSKEGTQIEVFVGPDKNLPSGVHMARLDAPGDTLLTTDALLNRPVTNSFCDGGAARYPVHFRYGLTFVSFTATDSIRVSVLGYPTLDGTGPVTVSDTVEWRPTAGELGTPATREAVADFSGAGSPILSYRLSMVAGADNQPGDHGPYVGAISATLFVLPVFFADVSDLLRVSSTLPLVNQQTLPLGGVVLSHFVGDAANPAVSQNYDTVANLTLPLYKWASLINHGLRVYLGFRVDKSSDRVLSNLLTVSEAGDALSVDISTLSTDARKNIRYVDLVFASDVPLSTPLGASQTGGLTDGASQTGGLTGGFGDASQTLFSLGALSEAGTLTLGLSVLWRLSYFTAESGHENDGTGPQTQSPYPATRGVESSGSAYSTALRPTTTLAQADLVVPPGAIPPLGVTHFIFWRRGGIYADRGAQLIAFVPIGADASGPGWTWNGATRTLHDNVPDSTLEDLPPIYETGRDKPPSGITDLVVHDGRLWLAKGNALYCSWLLRESDENGLYFTYAPDPSDPAIYSKGAEFTLASSFDTDAIVSMQPLGGNLLVFRQQSVNIVSGTDATNFEAVPYLVSAGVGCLARRGVCQAFGRRVWFVGASGIQEFDLNDAQRVSLPLEPLLSARNLTPAAYAKIALCAHDDGVFAFAPVAGGVENAACYVFDRRTESWGMWTGLPFTGATGAVSVASQEAGHDLYVAGVGEGGSGGQLYKLAGRYGTPVPGGDQATPGGPNVPIHAFVVSRLYGAPNLAKQRASALFFDAETLGSADLHWVIRSGAEARGSDYTFTKRRSPLLQSVGEVRGRAHQIEITADVVNPLRLYGMGLRVSENGKEN